MSECKCGQWGQQGECVYCGEHYTDRWDQLQAEMAALRRTVANMEYERNNQLPNYGIYAAGSFIKLLRKKLDEDRLCYHDAIDYCIQNELEWAVPRKEESSGE